MDETQNHEPAYALHPDLTGFVAQALAEGDADRLKDHLAELHSADLAELIRALGPEQRARLVELAGETLSPEILVDLDFETREEMFRLLGAHGSAEAITQLHSDDAVQVIEYLAPEERREILDALPGEKREELEEALSLPEDAAGRLAEKKYVAVPTDWTVGRTIDYLRDEKGLPTDFHNIFVVDGEEKPVGAVLTSQVIRNQRNVPLRDIMDTDVKTISPDMDQEEVGRIFQKYWLVSAPVVDEDGRITGVIAIDDIVDVMDEEAEEDLLLFAGMAETDLHAQPLEKSKRRLPWLSLNLVTASSASLVVGLFAYAIQEIVALAVLMPLVAALAGNAGSQALAVSVRGLATRELTGSNAYRVVGKEALAAVLNGFALAVLGGTACYAIYDNALLSLVFGVSLFGAVTLGVLAGAGIPLLLARLGADPAVSSTVFLITLTDLSAFFIFLGLAAWVLV